MILPHCAFSLMLFFLLSFFGTFCSSSSPTTRTTSPPSGKVTRNLSLRLPLSVFGQLKNFGSNSASRVHGKSTVLSSVSNPTSKPSIGMAGTTEKTSNAPEAKQTIPYRISFTPTTSEDIYERQRHLLSNMTAMFKEFMNLRKIQEIQVRQIERRSWNVWNNWMLDLVK